MINSILSSFIRQKSYRDHKRTQQSVVVTTNQNN